MFLGMNRFVQHHRETWLASSMCTMIIPNVSAVELTEQNGRRCTDEEEHASHCLTKHDDLRQILFNRQIYRQSPKIFWCSENWKARTGMVV